jgi:hypothetical protein
MAKKKGKKNKKKGYPKKPRTESRWMLLVGVLVVVVGAGGYWWWGSRPVGGSALGARPAFALPAIPRSPRPATLPPGLFTGKVAKAYRIAREAPELIERMPCYCGCYKTNSHQNNLDCYVDKHAAG